MKLFNKTIDRQLFKQYSLGSDLSKQEVVAKIFNPTGNGRWYILNSDPEDPDYLWAIVDLGYGAEVGSVSRNDLETYRGRFGLGFERDLGFDPINAEELYQGLRNGKYYADGGQIEVVYERSVGSKKPIKLLLLNKGKEQKGYTFSGKDQVSVLENYNRNEQEDLEKLWNLKGYESKYADGGEVSSRLSNNFLIVKIKGKTYKTWFPNWLSINKNFLEKLNKENKSVLIVEEENGNSKQFEVPNRDLMDIWLNDKSDKKTRDVLIQKAIEYNNNSFADGGSLSNYDVVIDGDWDEPKKFRTFSLAKKWIYENVKNYESLELVDPYGDSIFVEGNSTKEDLDWLFSNDEVSAFAKGGNIEDFSDNQRMIMNQNVEVEHHHEELEDILEDKIPVPAWVVAKMETATQNLSDITHYLDGQKEIMEDQLEEEDDDDDDDEMEMEEIENKEVVEPIVVTAGNKTEITKNFTDDAWDNLRGFLKGFEGIELRDDYTFDYKDEQFEVEPIINSDENGVSNAVFTIFDGDGEEVGEIDYSREGGKQKFTANSEFFSWNGTKFEDGGFMNGVYAKGGIVDVEKVNKADEIYREHNRERKEKGIENFSKESVALWNEKYNDRLEKLKLTLEEKNALNPKKWYADGGYFDGAIPKTSSYMSNFAKGGMVVTSVKDIPNFTERLEQRRITYRGLGMGKLANDFYKLAGTSGTRIKVDGKEYFITDEEFDKFSRSADGKMQIRFEAPARKGYADGGFMADVYANGGSFEKVRWQDVEIGDSARVKELNRLGLIVHSYGRKFNLKFPNGTEKTFDASDLEFYKLEKDEYQLDNHNNYAKGGKLNFKERSERDSLKLAKAYQKFLDSDFDETEYNKYINIVKETQIPKEELQKIEFYISTTPKGQRRMIDTYRYWGKNEFAKGGNLKKYILKADIKTVTVKRKDKEVTYNGADVLNGAHVLAKGGDITSKANYVGKNDVVEVELKDGSKVKPANGYWIKKGAEPIGAEPTPTPSGKSETKFGETYIKKDMRNNWKAETTLDDFNDYDWRISTIKTYSGKLVSSAQGGKTEPTGSKGIQMWKYTMYQDPNYTLEVSTPKRLTEKLVAEQHEKALAKFKKFMETGMFKGGGKISNFDKLSAKVAKQYEGKPVKSQYQEEYGKYYSKEEAQEVGDKVAGKVKAMQPAKKEKGGETQKMSSGREMLIQANQLAKKIRKDGESWNDAKKRAFAQLKK
jgi:hypothetical protein